MREWILSHLSMAWLEAFLLLLGGLAMVSVSYALRSFIPLHSHPWTQRLGWRRSFVFLLVPFLPFWSDSVGFMFIPPILAMAAFQVERLWLVKALGPEGYLDLLHAAAARSTRRFAVFCNLGAGLLLAASAGALWVVYPDPSADWAFWFALGLGLYAVINAYERAGTASRLFTAKPKSGAI